MKEYINARIHKFSEKNLGNIKIPGARWVT